MKLASSLAPSRSRRLASAKLVALVAASLPLRRQLVASLAVLRPLGLAPRAGPRLELRAVSLFRHARPRTLPQVSA